MGRGSNQVGGAQPPQALTWHQSLRPGNLIGRPRLRGRVRSDTNGHCPRNEGVTRKRAQQRPRSLRARVEGTLFLAGASVSPPQVPASLCASFLVTTDCYPSTERFIPLSHV